MKSDPLDDGWPNVAEGNVYWVEIESTGLGLSITPDIVKAHGGEIQIKTKQKEGTIFLITLPGK